MSSSFSYDVFLSYNSDDKDVVRSLAKRLRNDGLRVWFDEWVIGSSHAAAETLQSGLEHSRVLILCTSTNALGTDLARLEAATLPFRLPANTERRFIPIRLDYAPPPDFLEHFVLIDYSPGKRDEGYHKLLARCLRPAGLPVVERGGPTNDLVKKVISLKGAEDLFLFEISGNQERALTSYLSDYGLIVWSAKTGRSLGRLEGHTGIINGVAWNADSTRAVTGSHDKTIRLWDIASRRCLRVLEGHTSAVWSMDWSADERQLLSSGKDSTVRLWDVKTGRCLYVFEGHTDGAIGVIWGPDGHSAISGGQSAEAKIRLWDIPSGNCRQVFGGHTSHINELRWVDPRRFISCSGDKTLRLWDAEGGHCLRVFEGHTASVGCIAWNATNRLLLSGSTDQTVRVWDVETGRCLRILEGHTKGIQTLNWNVDQRYALSGDSNGKICIWDIAQLIEQSQVADPTISTGPVGGKQIQYTNAKVLLVGDTGVGKSGLAERLVRRQFVPTKSSHARKAHVLESKVLNRPGDVSLHQETVLWDLAGQPAYRLVHQLSMEDAALACVLFDCRNETNPFEGAAYWSQVLDQIRTRAEVRKFLVASRIDVGGLPASRERIEAFRRENDFAQFLATSASTGEGCEELFDAIRQAIPWEDLPTVTTTTTLAAMRDFVGELKKQSDHLLTLSELQEGFAAHFGQKIPMHEFIAHLERLEATDTLDLLLFRTTGAEPGPETPVLLDPTRVDAYASALLVAAKDEPDGPGHILESRVRDGDFKLDADERLRNRVSERQVLWFVMENLLSRDLALRERIGGNDYLVFPSQCTAELTFPGVATFGVAFGFAGSVRSIYATLIAQLAHYEGFKEREFFQDAAAYRADARGRCLVRLRDLGHGLGELQVSFEGQSATAVRQGFLEFVGKHLEAKAKPGSVTRRHAYHCANAKCGQAFDDAVVKANLAARQKDLLCPYCRKITPLVNLLAHPSAAAESVAAKIDTDAKLGRRRMTAALVIKAKETEGTFDVFLSHNSKDKNAVEKIAKQLLKVGLRPWLDKWNLSPGDTVSDALEKAIEDIPCAALCFGPADKGRWHIMEIRGYVEKWAAGDSRMIPVILPEVDVLPKLPLFVRQTLWVDMRQWENPNSDGFYRLVCGILGKAPGDSPLKRFGVRDVAEWQGRRV